MIRVEIATCADHSNIYKQIIDSWKPYKLEEIKVGEFIPTNSEYLDSYIDASTAHKDRIFAFKLYVPQPRKLTRLDALLEAHLRLELSLREGELDTVSDITECIQAVCNEVFTSELEREWWESYRKVLVKEGKKGAVVKIIDKTTT